MKQRTRNKLTSMLLVLCMLLSLLPSSVIAAEETEQTGVPQPVTPAVTEETVAAAAVDPMQLAESCNILNYVDENVFREGNHIARLNAEETLSSYAFLNSDGTVTVYYLDEEVKFVNTDGTIQEKDITLTAAVGGYTTACNDVSLSLPTNPASGISLVYGNYTATLIPQGGTLSEPLVLENNSVTYPNYYGEGMDLVYTPTLSGVKEDIVLDSYTGVNSFTFMLNTRGLNLYQANGRYFLAPSKVSDMRIELGDIVSFDARGRFSVGTMTATTVIPGSLYRLTLTVDEGFLTDENTTYPVSIDPSLKVSDSTHGAGAIEDATLYSGSPSLNSGSWTYLHCGYYDSTYQISRTAIGLTGMINDDEFWYIPYDGVTSAKFYIREAGWTAGVTVNMHEIRGTWSENTITWSSHGNSYYSDIVASASPSYGNYAEFDITEIIQDWRARDDYGNGFMLVSSNETSVDKTLYSSEHGTTASRPYVEVTYDPDIDIDPYYLELKEGQTGTLTVSGVSGTVTWTSSDTNIATVDSNGVVTGIKSGTATITASVAGYMPATCLVYVSLYDGYYRFYNGGTGYALGVADGSFADLSSVQQQNNKNSTAGKLSQIWKITYDWLGEYTIQPAHRETMSLVANSGYARITDNSANDAYTVWNIEYDGSGYVVKNDRTGQCLHPYSNSTTNGTAVALGNYSSNNFFRWNINANPLPSGLVLYDLETERCISSDLLPGTKYVELQAASNLPLLAQAIDPTGTYHNITWSSSAPSVATVGASSGMVTGWKRGKATITVSCTINGSVYSESFTLIVRETITVVHYFDMSIATATAVHGNFDDAVDFLNKVYSDTFYLKFVSDYSVKAMVDDPHFTCEHRYTDPCTNDDCGSSCLSHHKNVLRISRQLRQNYEKNHIYVLWSDAESTFYCVENGIQGHIPISYNLPGIETVFGVVCNKSCAIQTFSVNHVSSQNLLAHMSLTLAHEVAHTLGLDEAYEDRYSDGTFHDGSNTTYECIMESYKPNEVKTFYDAIIRGSVSPLCDHCIANLHTVIPANAYDANVEIDANEEE